MTGTALTGGFGTVGALGKVGTPAAAHASGLTSHFESFALPFLTATSLTFASIAPFVETVSKCARSCDMRSVRILVFPSIRRSSSSKCEVGKDDFGPALPGLPASALVVEPFSSGMVDIAAVGAV